MELTLEAEEMDAICDALQMTEQQLAESEPQSERLKAIRRVFQRLQTLRTAK